MVAGPRSVFCRVWPGIKRGVETVREMVKACRDLGVEYLTAVCLQQRELAAARG